jgi:hypothetical protein
MAGAKMVIDLEEKDHGGKGIFNGCSHYSEECANRHLKLGHDYAATADLKLILKLIYGPRAVRSCLYPGQITIAVESAHFTLYRTRGGYRRM